MADLRKFMSERGWAWKEVQRSSGLIAVLNCPFCSDTEKKFAVKLDDGCFKCNHANRCGVSGSFWDLQKMLGIQNPQRADGYKFIHTPPKYERPKAHAENLSSRAMEYLKGRGLWGAVIHQFKIGQTGDEIMFPYFKNGELVNIKYRGITEKKFRQEKNAEPSLFGRDFCTGDYVILCEGEFDAMSLSQLGEPAVSIPSGAKDTRWIETEWDFLQKFQKIYLCFDNDAAGQENIFEIVKRLGKWRCYNILLPYKDANEGIQKDLDDVKFKAILESATSYDPEILKNAAQFTNDVLELFKHPETLYGLSTPWKQLNDIIRGWRDGELTVISGRNGSGKTTWINQVIDGLLEKKQPTIIASLEIPPKRYLRWMVMQKLNNHCPDDKEVVDTMKWIGENLYILDVYGDIAPNELIDAFDFAARKYGVKKFIIDSMIKIQFPETDPNKEAKQFVNSLIDRLCKYHQGHTFLVCHPRKGDRDSDEPDKVDIQGSGNITNLADNVIIIWRRAVKEQGKADNVAFVKKNREWGTEGHVNYEFNEATKKFTEC